jgi:hypothetical protein
MGTWQTEDQDPGDKVDDDDESEEAKTEWHAFVWPFGTLGWFYSILTHRETLYVKFYA